MVAQGILCSFWGANWKTIGVALLSFIPVVWIININSKLPKFDVILTASNAPNKYLWLTNVFLNVTDPGINKPQILSHADGGCLVIPYNKGETNIMLELSLLNPSSAFVDDPETTVVMNPRFPMQCGRDWQVGSLPNAFSAGQWQLAYIARTRLFLLDGTPLPDIWVNPYDVSEYGFILVTIRVRAQEVEPSFLSFWLLFAPTDTQDKAPYMVPPKDITYKHIPNSSNMLFFLKEPILHR